MTEGTLTVLDDVRGTAPMTVDGLKRRADLIQEALAKVLKRGVHFMKIPGAPKDSLLKAGGEKIASMFGFAPKIRIEDLSTKDEKRFRAIVSLHAMPNETFVGEGAGACSSTEERFAWRKPVCKEEYDETDGDFKRHKWIIDKDTREPVKIYQIRTNPADQENAVLKRSVKRAFLAAVIGATAASDALEPRDDDEEDDGDEGEKKKSRKPAPGVQHVTAGIEKFTKGKGKWWDVVIAGVKYSSEDSELQKIAEEAASVGAKVSMTWQEKPSGNGVWKKVLGIKAIIGPDTKDDAPPSEEEPS